MVGLSGGCGVPDAYGILGPARHAVVCRNGRVFDLGGVMNNAAFAIKEAGRIVGQSDLPGDSIGTAIKQASGTP